MNIDERPCGSARLTHKRLYNSLPRTSLEGALGAVLGFYTGVRYHPEDLRRAFFSTRFARVLDPLGYVRLMNWRVYAEEALAKRDVALWLGGDTLSVEYAGETLSRYEVEYQPSAGGLREVGRPELFETA